MTEFKPTRLFDLLPQLYRARDAEPPAEGALKALLDVVQQQVDIVHADITQLWGNFFIETCDDWVIPYIGDLVGANLIAPVVLRARADVAKTIHYRRRKGTVPMLEELARDVTGWSAKVVESFQILGWTQNINHVRLPQPLTSLYPWQGNGGWFDLKNDSICNAVGTAFDRAAHTVDVRAPTQAEGWHNIRNLGIFVWRLQSYSLVHAEPRSTEQPHCFHFHSVGQPQPLFIQPDLTGLTERATNQDDVRGPLRPRRLNVVELAIQRAEPPDADGNVALQLNPPDAPLVENWTASLWLELIDPDNGAPTLSAILVEVREKGLTLVVNPGAPISTQTRLRAFPALPLYYGQRRGMSVYAGGERIAPTAHDAAHRRRVVFGDLCNWRDPAPGTLVIDVVLGRFAFAPGETPVEPLRVDFNYGFSGDIGAGPYIRDVHGAPTIVVSQTGGAPTLDAALTEWQTNPPANAVIEIQDSRTYNLAKAALVMPNRHFQLTVRAASGERPTILLASDWQMTGGHAESGVTLEGLLISGGEIDLQGTLGELNIRNCTLDPGGGLSSDGATKRPMQQSLWIAAANTKLKIGITQSIVGALRVPNAVEEMSIDNSIVDAGDGIAIAGLEDKEFAARSTLRATTIFGQSWFQELMLASDVLFNAPVYVLRKQNGCVRFSYFASISDTPRRYRCIPFDGASSDALARVTPAFTSTRYGDPGYGQLSRDAATEIETGGSEGVEIGAFFALKNSWREQNLRMRLDEYLPFGLTTGLVYVT